MGELVEWEHVVVVCESVKNNNNCKCKSSSRSPSGMTTRKATTNANAKEKLIVA